MSAGSKRRGLLTLADVSSDELDALTARAGELRAAPDAHDFPLERRAVGVLFTHTSTRTRTAFTVGTIRLGGAPVTFGPGDLQTNTGEAVADTGHIFAAMLDLLVARTVGPMEDLRLLTHGGVLPVINAMSAEEHPTQAICDVSTMRAHFGSVEGVRLLYVGEGNNTATALCRAFSMIPRAHVVFATPRGYGVPADLVEECARRGASTGARIAQVHDLASLPDEVDVVYTTRWQTTGTSKRDPSWRERFRPFYVGEALMARWPDAMFMHDLPAHRGEEVAGAVLDGPQSLAWAQAEMKLWSAMSILEHAVRG